MKFLIRLVILFSLLFLFGGLVAVGAFGNGQSNKKLEKKSGIKIGIQPASESYSMKQIDSLTAKYNTYFTAANANGSAYYP